jgi:Icc-related predicted phosphoesterase
MRIGAIADIHVGLDHFYSLRKIIDVANDKADILVIAGDLTNTGDPAEAKQLVELLKPLKIPTVAVLGNHDYDRELQDEISAILTGENIHVLEGSTFSYQDVFFAGTKGFAGGFGKYQLGAWGEPVMKTFVQESVNYMLKLEAAMRKTESDRIVVVTHYAPIEATVIGEPEPIYPFLGSSHLESPINNFKAKVAFHGHAHHGSLEGETKADIPVYNVSLPVLERSLIEDLIYIHEL